MIPPAISSSSGKSMPRLKKAWTESLSGIGNWTVDVYLLMALLRPDVWPPGDLALLKSLQQVKRLRSLPSREKFLSLGERWRPWRSVAARLLWHDYLKRRGRA